MSLEKQTNKQQTNKQTANKSKQNPKLLFCPETVNKYLKKKKKEQKQNKTKQKLS